MADEGAKLAKYKTCVPAIFYTSNITVKLI